MRKAPGRPPLADDDESVSVHLRLTPRDYDAYYQRAQQDRVSVPEAIRRRLRDRPPELRDRK